MAEVMNMPLDSLDQAPSQALPATAVTSPTPSSPQTLLQSQPPLQRRKDRDLKERREDDAAPAAARDRETDRPHSRQRGGEYYGRNLSPPPRDRDRDYKRRRSPSPGYRDRRYSPSSRLSPSVKRYRKEDYDRRGSPRGGFGPDDRRSGHDHAGGYERGTGGRGFSSSNRLYGRSTNLPMSNNQNGSSELESGKDLGAEGTDREGLMSYKQFIQELEDDILPTEAEQRYKEYRSGYISTQKKTYFEAHKDDEWLKDMYHPTNLLAVIERRNAHVRGVAKEVLLDLQSGTLDIGPSVISLTSKAPDPYSDEELENGENRRRHSRGQGRSKESDLADAPKAHVVTSSPRRVQADIRQTLALVRKLDNEKGVEENILCPSDVNMNENKTGGGGSSNPIVIIEGLTSFKGLEGTELLDTLLTYLWRVHGLDYYGMIETNDAKGFRHVRVDTIQSDESIKAIDDDWEKKLDSFYQERLNGKDPLEKRSSKEKVEAATVQVLEPYVRKIRDEKYGWKYGCGAKGCTKLFHASEFVHKHLKLKHLDVVTEMTSKVLDDIFHQNYMSDPDSPGGAPTMRKLVQKDRAPRRRSGMDGRLRDDRGGYQRDHSRTERKRYEMSDNSPRDYPSESGDLDGEIPEATYDSFRGGQGMSSFPPLSSEVPSVLMPVPGAGPLGPFVPAPPEVAMRMMREQGGSSSSYEGSGRKRSAGIDGSSPIISIPTLRQDPRRIRSYQDLDAPEDVVTVIDYRSL